MEKGSDLDSKEVEKRLETLISILRSTIKVILWLMISMLVLRAIGIDIAPIIAGAGIAGLAVGFGAQELVRDFITGFFMLLENQIREGDVAIINGTGGLVEHVGMRTIVLRPFWRCACFPKWQDKYFVKHDQELVWDGV